MSVTHNDVCQMIVGMAEMAQKVLLSVNELVGTDLTSEERMNLVEALSLTKGVVVEGCFPQAIKKLSSGMAARLQIKIVDELKTVYGSNIIKLQTVGDEVNSRFIYLNPIAGKRVKISLYDDANATVYGTRVLASFTNPDGKAGVVDLSMLILTDLISMLIHLLGVVHEEKSDDETTR